MEYDPIKEIIAPFMTKSVFFRKVAYRMYELGFLRVMHIKRAIKVLSPFLARKNNVLDAGFGFGYYSDLLLKTNTNLNLVGIEINETDVEACRKFADSQSYNNRAEFRFGDLSKLSDNNLFDFILSVDVMEHIQDDVSVLENFYRALRKDGILLIHTPSSKIDSRMIDNDDFFVAEHVREGWSPDEAREKLTDAGFRDISIKYTYGKYGAIAWKLMQGIPLAMINKTKFIAIILPIWYLFVFPIAHRFMLADLGDVPEWGGGLLIQARKPS